jgi:hypothetical protein
VNRYTLVPVFIVMAPALACADEHVHTTASRTDPPIQITINPEARVSVTLGGALPSPVACGRPATLSVRILNQGVVTSRLEVQLVAEPPAGATLEFHPAPLNGAPQEQRELRITLAKPGLTDLTIAFRAHNEAPDIGGRDRVHFLMHCLAPD